MLHYTNCNDNYTTCHYTTYRLHYSTQHYSTLRYTTLHHNYNCNYTTLITLHYSYNSTTLQLQLQLRYTTLHPAVVGEVNTATIAAKGDWPTTTYLRGYRKQRRPFYTHEPESSRPVGRSEGQCGISHWSLFSWPKDRTRKRRLQVGCTDVPAALGGWGDLLLFQNPPLYRSLTLPASYRCTVWKIPECEPRGRAAVRFRTMCHAHTDPIDEVPARLLSNEVHIYFSSASSRPSGTRPGSSVRFSSS